MENNVSKQNLEELTDKFDEECEGEDFIVVVKTIVEDAEYRLVKQIGGKNHGEYSIKVNLGKINEPREVAKAFVDNKIEQSKQNIKYVFEQFMIKAKEDTKLPEKLREDAINFLSLALNADSVGIK